MRACWCGNGEFAAFNATYRLCVVCGTLVSQDSLTDEQLVVADDETDFYGKQYWLAHQAHDLGFPDIYARARNDLTERNLHWLRTLVAYRPPPARALEIGCGHGSFVGLMAQAGYDASGLEMSAWVVEFGKETFGVPIALGPVESQPIDEGTLDVLVSFDVLEHLPDPLATMHRCLQLLKPGGMLLIQTPRFPDGLSYAEMVEGAHPFLGMLQPDEHLYLFTAASVTRLFAQLGAPHVRFEPAIFSQYDMFLAVSRSPLEPVSTEEAEASLLGTPRGRMAQALLDVRRRELSLADALQVAESDRALRGEQVDSLSGLLDIAERDRIARAGQVGELTALLTEAESDRLARGRQVETLTAMLTESETDRAARDEARKTLTLALQESERDRADRGAQVDTLAALLQEAEVDRAARGEQIVALTAMLTESESDRAARGMQIETLTTMVRQAAADRAAREENIAAWRVQVRAVLERMPVNGHRQREQWTELSLLIDQIGNVDG